MTPKLYFDEVWFRAEVIGSIHAYIAKNVAAALDPSELLRAEWAMKVSALDLYIHEVVAQNLLKIFQGTRPPCPGFFRVRISNETLMRIHNAGRGFHSDNAFDLEVRTMLSRITFQYPDEIADGIRMISSIELWNEVVKFHGASASSASSQSKAMRGDLTQIVNRRNKIVHEGDLGPSIPRAQNYIDRSQVDDVSALIQKIVIAIDALV